jgi:hypothetical protein
MAKMIATQRRFLSELVAVEDSEASEANANVANATRGKARGPNAVVGTEEQRKKFRRIGR